MYAYSTGGNTFQTIKNKMIKEKNHQTPIVGIIGLGLMGGSLGFGLKESGFAGRVLGADQRPEHCAKALELGFIDEAGDVEQLMARCDLLVAATPVHALSRQLPQWLDALQETQVLLDVGSTKAPLLEAVKSHPKRSRYVATHPMAGTEFSGPEAAVRGLFAGKRCVFCDIADSAPDAVAMALQLYASLGMEVSFLNGTEHDVHVAYISHISHIASFALALTVLAKEKEEERIFELAGGGFSSTARLAKSNADTWIPIFTQNRDNVLDVLDEFINTVSRFRTLLIKKDFETFDQLIRQANEIGKILR